MTSKTMDNPEKLVTQGTQDKKQNNGQSRETGNIGTQGYDKQNNGQSRETGNIWYKANKQNNGQSRETGNIGYTRQRQAKQWTIQRNW